MDGCIATWSVAAADGRNTDRLVAADGEGWVVDGVTAVATGWLAGGPVAAMAYSTTINETTQDPGICWDEYLFYQPRVIMYMHLLLYYSLFLLLYYSLLCVSRRSDHGNEGSYQNTA